MTQTIGAIRRGFLFQTSDRQISLDEAGYPAVDLRSNKALVLFPKNAVCLMAYSGNAVMGKVPTDTWLAGAVASIDTARWLPASDTNVIGRYDVGQLMRCVEDRLRSYVTRLGTKRRAEFRLFVHLIGYTTKRGRLKPVVFRLSCKKGAVSMRYESPLAESIQGAYTCFTPALASQLEFDRVIQNLQSYEDSPPGVLEAMGRAMAVTTERGGVGSSWLGIVVDTGRKVVNLNFAEAAPDQIDTPVGTMKVLWTPWLLSTGNALPPAHVTPGLGIELPFVGYRVSVAVAPPSDVPPRPGDPIMQVGFVPQDRRPVAAPSPVTHRTVKRTGRPYFPNRAFPLASRFLRFHLMALRSKTSELSPAATKAAMDLLGGLSVPQLIQGPLIAGQFAIRQVADSGGVPLATLTPFFASASRRLASADHLSIGERAYSDAISVFDLDCADRDRPPGKLDPFDLLERDAKRGTSAALAFLATAMEVSAELQGISPIRATEMILQDLTDIDLGRGRMHPPRPHH